MSAPKSFNICETISCHCWNKDGTKIAYSPCSKEIVIAKFENGKFTTEARLKEHDARVTGIDWAPESNRIVSCSEDRNALVWTQNEKDEWMHVLVLLRIDFAATDVKWSPNEQKFACASGNKLVAICKYNEEQIAWSPDSLTVAAASTDFRARIFNAFSKGLDQKGATSPFTTLDISSPKCRLGSFLYEAEVPGWVQSVAYTPSGYTCVFVSHDSSISFIEANNGEPYVQTIKTKFLPFLDVLCLTDNKVVAVGHNFSPCLFERQEDGWVFTKELDQKKEVKAAESMSAMDKFKSMTARGTAAVVSAVEEIPTRHKNTVTCVRAIKYDENWNCLEFSTSGVDGNLVIWKA
ncbi:Actin-related protein 2/3 complex subunit [Entamoeba marina]